MKISHLFGVGVIFVMVSPAGAQSWLEIPAASGSAVTKTISEVNQALVRTVVNIERSVPQVMDAVNTDMMNPLNNQAAAQLNGVTPRNASDDYYSPHSEGRYAVHTVQSAERYLQRRRTGLGDVGYREYHEFREQSKPAKEKKEEQELDVEEQPAEVVEDTPQGTATENNTEPAKVPAVSRPTKAVNVSAETNRKP